MTTKVKEKGLKRFSLVVGFNYVRASDEHPRKSARQMEVSIDGYDFEDVARVLATQGFATVDGSANVFVPGSQIITITEVKVEEKGPE